LEDKQKNGVKWSFLEHKGPVFAAPYESLPKNVIFFYNGQTMKLSEVAEQIAGLYAKMLDHDYTKKKIFNKNFFEDWRACNQKDEDQADTVGCCSLRCEHIELHEEKDGKYYVVVFDFLGKDSIRYYNEVPVEKRVFKNLRLFMENKKKGDDLFDKLNTQILNKYLNDLMKGLTAKVFRTYNASWTLQRQLDDLTNEDDSIAEKILSYNRANRAVAVLCNLQKAVPKGHQRSMDKLKEKIDSKRDQIEDAKRQVKDARRKAKHGSIKKKMVYDNKKKMLERLKDQLAKLEIKKTDREDNKTIDFESSKLNYIDPRITVAWCKKHSVPIEKIYNKTQLERFRWAIDMDGPDY
ncbi:hypothetical protein YQE_11400, partial [Dendroctonus ponderosae]